MGRTYVHSIDKKWDANFNGTGRKLCPLINEEEIG